MSLFRRRGFGCHILSLAVAATLPAVRGPAAAPDTAAPDAAADAAAEQADAEPAGEEGLTVPALPADADPKELLAFVAGLMPPKQQPRSREEMFDYIKGVSQLAVEAADRVMAQVKPDDDLYGQAARLKFESLSALGQLGEERAADDLAAFAATLVDSPVKPLAMEARRMVIVTEARKMFSSGEFGGAAAVVQQTADLVAADPDDPQSAGLAMQLVAALEQAPEASEATTTALETLAPIMAKSGNEQVRQVAEGFAGKLRLISLPGNPMEIQGDLLDGTPFDPASFAGKVVLVDFWATWCGPCMAEIPNMLAEYEKYHDKGFEVVGISLDEDRAEVEKFVADNNIPWPIIFAGKGWGDPVVKHYGISGIPQMVLIGRDGNVISLDLRGEKLGTRLAELFKDAG